VVPDAFRDARSEAHAAEDDDQRRLLYVALTRARDLVVVTGPTADGDGEWLPLSGALTKLAPSRVRIIRPGETPPAVPVRATYGAEPDTVRFGGAISTDPIDPPLEAQHGLVLYSSAVREFERCPRRYLARFELHLDEPARGDPCLAAVRELIASLDLERFALEPHAAIRAAASALSGGEFDARTLDAAVASVQSFARSRFARVFTADDALVGRAIPLAVAFGHADRTVRVHTRIDVLSHADALDLDADLALLSFALADDPVSIEEATASLEIANASLRSTLANSDIAPRLCNVILVLGAEDIRSVRIDAVADDALEARVLALGDAMRTARSMGEWQGRERRECERMNCELVARCHGHVAPNAR
jgi:hypothetical protein